MNNCNKMKLSDCCLSISDGDHMPPPKCDNGIPFITISDIDSNNEINFSNTMFVPQEYWDSLDNKRKPRTGDVLYTVTGSYGIPVYISKEKEFVFQRHIAILRPDTTVIDGKYLYYCLKSPTMKKLVDKLVTGAVQKTLGLEMIRNIEIPVPSLETQRKLIGLLDKLDDKIKNNNSICADLEAMAKQLYDYWFIQFDYPDENGKPYKSSGGKMVRNEALKREIPEGWNVAEIGSVIDESPKSAVQVNGANMSGIFPFFTSGEQILCHDTAFVDGFNCFLNTGGNPDIKGYFGEAAYSTDTWCISAREYSIWLYLYINRILPNFEQLFFTGSGLKHLQKDAFKKHQVVIPSIECVRKFNTYAENLYIKKAECFLENEQLTQLRDFLLPMLMNGQVKIKEKEDN